MATTLPTIKELFKAGAHFGHVKSRTDARAKDYIFTYRNKVSVIDLEKTLISLAAALEFIESKAKEGALILFVGTKPQAKEKVKEIAEKCGQPYIIERWPGGLVTNFEMIIQSIKKMIKIESDISENKYEHLTKKERLKIERNLLKMQKIFGGLRNLTRKPDVIFVIDANREMNAVLESKTSRIKTAAICDTNSNPKVIDFPIVANDDSQSTIGIIMDLVAETFTSNFKPKEVAKEDVEKRVEEATKPAVAQVEEVAEEAKPEVAKAEVKKPAAKKSTKTVAKTKTTKSKK